MTSVSYSSFEGVSSDHRIATVKIRLSLRKNVTRSTSTGQYDWALLNNKDIRDKFDAPQEKKEVHTPNDDYDYFVNAYSEVAAECMQTKQRTKSRVPWETLAVRGKRVDVKTASKCNGKNTTNINALKLKKAQNELVKIFLKEQTGYIQNQIDNFRDSVEDRQSKIA